MAFPAIAVGFAAHVAVDVVMFAEFFQDALDGAFAAHDA